MKKSVFVVACCLVVLVIAGVRAGIAWMDAHTLFLMYKDGKYGYIDRKGNLVVGFQFDAAEDFSEGMAVVKQGEKWGLLIRRVSWWSSLSLTKQMHFVRDGLRLRRGMSGDIL